MKKYCICWNEENEIDRSFVYAFNNLFASIRLSVATHFSSMNWIKRAPKKESERESNIQVNDKTNTSINANTRWYTAWDKHMDWNTFWGSEHVADEKHMFHQLVGVWVSECVTADVIVIVINSRPSSHLSNGRLVKLFTFAYTQFLPFVYFLFVLVLLLDCFFFSIFCLSCVERIHKTFRKQERIAIYTKTTNEHALAKKMN